MHKEETLGALVSHFQLDKGAAILPASLCLTNKSTARHEIRTKHAAKIRNISTNLFAEQATIKPPMLRRPTETLRGGGNSKVPKDSQL